MTDDRLEMIHSALARAAVAIDGITKTKFPAELAVVAGDNYMSRVSQLMGHDSMEEMDRTIDEMNEKLIEAGLPLTSVLMALHQLFLSITDRYTKIVDDDIDEASLGAFMCSLTIFVGQVIVDATEGKLGDAL